MEGAGRSHTYRIPATAGDPEGATERVDPARLLRDLATAAGGGRAEGLVRDLAWLCNQAVPLLYATRRAAVDWYATDDWTLFGLWNGGGQFPPSAAAGVGRLVAHGSLRASDSRQSTGQ
ncbi:MAG: hypothetical protein ABEJ08_01425 [Halobacteriaceae archaeon]